MTYFQLSPTSKMELFPKVVNGWKMMFFCQISKNSSYSNTISTRQLSWYNYQNKISRFWVFFIFFGPLVNCDCDYLKDKKTRSEFPIFYTKYWRKAANQGCKTYGIFLWNFYSLRSKHFRTLPSRQLHVQS